MARAKSTDPLAAFRFHVLITGYGAGTDQQLGTGGLGAAGLPTAGFNSCGTPTLSEAAMEYREGHYIYTRKYPGLATVGDITLSRGVFLKDGSMFAWIKDVVEGNAEYRANVAIRHFHRDSKPASTSTSTNELMGINGSGGKGYVEYAARECFPTEYKPTQDLDSTSSEVAIQNLTLATESFNVTDTGPVT